MSGAEDNEPRVLRWQGPHPLPEIPNKNFEVFMLEEMVRHGDAVALIDAETRQQRTYSEMCDLVPRLSAGLAAAGVGAGDRVIYYSHNHIDYPLWLLAFMHRGAAFVRPSPTYENTKDDLVHCTRLVGAQWAVIHVDLLSTAEAAFSLLPPDTLKKIWVIGGAAGTSTIDDLAAHDPLPPVTQNDDVDPASTVCQIPFSSGTTGPRKGVMTSHRSEVSRMMMIKHLVNHKQWLGQPEDYSTCMLVTSLSHTYAHVFLFATLMLGGTSVIAHHSDNLLEMINEHKVTLAVLLPYHLKMMINSAASHDSKPTSLKAVTTAAAPLAASVAEAFRQNMDVSVYNMWGMTEVTSISTMCLVTSDYKQCCIGKIVPFFELKVEDVKTKHMLPPGQSGEFWIRSPMTLLGYVDNPAATAEIKDDDGWIHTGDYGHYDNQGFIYLTDRIKDLIKGLRNTKVLPSELENLLLQHPHVAEAVVVGVYGDDLEELPRAFVVLKPDTPMEPCVLLKFVNDRVPDYKQLRGGVWIVKDIPKNSSSKPLRGLLRDGNITPLKKC